MEALLLRWGLSFLAPLIGPTLVTLIIGGAFGTAWWNDWIDPVTTVCAVASCGLLYVYSATNSTVLRFIVMLAFGGLAYITGRMNENALTDEKIDTAVTEAVTLVRETYKAETEKEKARQAQVGTESRTEADVLKRKRFLEVTTLRSEVLKLRKEAADAPSADNPCFDLDAVDRLNRLRH